MRVAYVCCDPGVPVFGCKGSSIHVQEILRELLEQGHDVDLFATCLGGSCPADLAPIRIRALEISKLNSCADREQALLNLNGTVQLLLNQHGPYSLVYERYSLFSFAAMEFARAKFVPGILEVNSPLIDEQSTYRVLIHQEMAEQTTRRAMTAAGAVVAVSKAVGGYVQSQRFESNGIYVIPNGVDPKRFKLPSSGNGQLHSGEFTIGFVGTLKPWHGVAALLKAFPDFLEQVPNSRLLIVGDGPELENLKSLANSLLGEFQDRAVFLGSIEANKIPALLQCMDIAVAPYLPQENFYFSPLKIFEYMAAGLPIVASDLGQIADLIDDGWSGVLVQPGDSHELSEALVKLANDPELCLRLGVQAREVVEERFTWHSVVNRIIGIAEQIKQDISTRHRALHTQL